MKRGLETLILITTLFLFALPAYGQVPREINYQGILTDDTGTPLDGDYSIRFRIYPDSSTGAVTLWVEQHPSVAVDEGLFNVILGSSNPIPDSVFVGAWASNLWLGIEPSPGPEIDPRVRITSVPMAIRAAVADTVLNFPASGGDGHSLDADDGSPVDVVYVNQYGRVGIGTTTPGTMISLDVRQDANIPVRMALTNYDAGASSSMRLEFVDEEAGTVKIESNPAGHAEYPAGLLIANENPLGNITFKTDDGDAMHIEAAGNVGIGTFSPAEKLSVVGTVEMDGMKMSTGAVSGHVLTTDASGNGTWQTPAAVSDGDWVISGSEMYANVTGDVGVGVTNPRADFHVQGPSTVGEILVTPNVSVSGHSRISLAQDWNGNYGGYIKYDGTNGNIELGRKNASSDIPRLKINGLTPWVEIYGQDRQAVFSMGDYGGNSVVLPSDAIGSTEMGNETGVAAERYATGFILDGTKQTLLSRSISCPTGGYVLVIGSCQGRAIHTTGSSSSANFGVSDQAGTLPSNQDVGLNLPPTLSTGTYDIPVTVQTIFYVSGTSTETYYLIGEETAGDYQAYDLQLSLVFIPTAYGTVSSPFAGKTGDDRGDVPAMIASPTPADIAAERAETEALNRERLEREIAEIRAQIEELRAAR